MSNSQAKTSHPPGSRKGLAAVTLAPNNENRASRHWIMAAPRERMATHNTPQRQSTTAQPAMPHHRHIRVLAAGRQILALRSDKDIQQRRHRPLIDKQQSPGNALASRAGGRLAAGLRLAHALRVPPTTAAQPIVREVCPLPAACLRICSAPRSSPRAPPRARVHTQPGCCERSSQPPA
jgi:hypothetical protein